MNVKVVPYESSNVPPSSDGIDPLIASRESIGSFAPIDVDWDMVVQLLRAGSCAPSSYNSQPWRFIVVRKGPGRNVINDDFELWGAPWATNAPILLAVVASLHEGTKHNGLNYAPFDCGMAVQNILLQASSICLAAHPVGFQDRRVVEQALRLPESHQLLLFIAIGYSTGITLETNSRRARKPISAIASWDTWNGAPVLDR